VRRNYRKGAYNLPKSKKTILNIKARRKGNYISQRYANNLIDFEIRDEKKDWVLNKQFFVKRTK
jgi:hypothetical protein